MERTAASDSSASEDETESEQSSIVMNTGRRKRNFCRYCQRSQAKIARHLERKHRTSFFTDTNVEGSTGDSTSENDGVVLKTTTTKKNTVCFVGTPKPNVTSH